MKMSTLSNLIGLASVALALFFNSYVTSTFPGIKTSHLAAMGIAFFVIMLLDIKYTLKEISDGQKRTLITHADLNKCFTLVNENVESVSHMRVFANSTAIILPAFKNASFRVQKCELLVRTSAGENKSEDFDVHVAQHISQWESLCGAGRIDELKIARYDFIPTEWQVIFDDNLMIVGLDCPDFYDLTQIHVIEPALLYGYSEETRDVIQKYISRYDDFFGQYSKPREVEK